MLSKLFDLSGKKAVITGATGGIGYACAQALSQHGAEVFLLGRDSQKLENCRERISTMGGKVKAASIDLTDFSALRNFFSEQDFSDYNIWVNSAGVNRPVSFVQVTEKDYDHIMTVNVKSAFFQTQHFVKAIQGKHPASIIHISSQMGHVGGFDRTAYCASKHALEGFCKAAAWDLGRWEIRINTISPTFIETNMTRKTMLDSSKMKLIQESIALNRIGKVEDISGAVVYLACDASSLVTGSTLMVDGGWTAK